MTTSTLIIDDGLRSAYTLVDATDAPETVTIPSASIVRANYPFYYQKVDASANEVRITDGASLTISLVGQYDTVMLVSDGSTYRAQPTAQAGGAASAGLVDQGAVTMLDKQDQLACYSDYTGADFLISGSTSPISLPHYRINRPLLQGPLKVNTEHVCGFLKNNTTAQNIVFELVVDGVATGLSFTYALGTTLDGGGSGTSLFGVILFETEMRVFPSSVLDNAVFCFLNARLRYWNSSSALVIDLSSPSSGTALKRSTYSSPAYIDPSVDHDFSWRVNLSQSVATEDYFVMKGFAAWRSYYRTGA